MVQETGSTAPPGWAAALRVLIGIGVSIALALIMLGTQATLAGNRDATAIQITQVYAEGIFYAVIAIGFGIMGYVVTRAGR